jgi:hypothetical protein
VGERRISSFSKTLLPTPEPPMMVSVSPGIHVEVQIAVDDLLAEGLLHAARSWMRGGTRLGTRALL